MGDIGVGVGGVNPLPAGTGGTLWYYSPQSGVRNFPKKLTFLRLNDLVNFHNFTPPQKKLTFLRLSIFLRFLSNFIPKKIDIFLYPPPSYFKKASRQNFSRKFSNFVHTIKKTIFNFAFFAL